ncbi:MAG: hypothetical protein ACRDY2_11670, partial [Acidimicrobiales bacterium]
PSGSVRTPNRWTELIDVALTCASHISPTSEPIAHSPYPRKGHEDPAFTMKQYAHVIPGMQAEAAELVAALVARSSSTAG